MGGKKRGRMKGGKEACEEKCAANPATNGLQGSFCSICCRVRRTRWYPRRTSFHPSIHPSTQPAGGRGLNIDELGSPVATHGGARTLNIVADAAAVAEVVMCAKHSSLSTAAAANLLVRRARRISPFPSPPPMQCISIRAVTSNIFLTLPSVSFPLSFFLSQPHPECRCGNEDRLLGSK